MATDLTFINNINHAYDSYGPGDKDEAALKFYSATNTDTQAVNRFVKAGSRSYANGGHLEFEAIAADTDEVLGVVIGHTHDDPAVEFNGTVAVGKQARVIQRANRSIWVEVASDLKTTLSTPNVKIAPDAAGYAKAAATGDRVCALTAGGGDGVGWLAIGGKYFVKVYLHAGPGEVI